MWLNLLIKKLHCLKDINTLKCYSIIIDTLACFGNCDLQGQVRELN